jgi:HAD superfamily hydrolase (TIGR01509 family)
VDALIFDMDGVLVDSEPVGTEAMRRVLAPYGLGYTEADNNDFLGRTTPESCRILKARHGLAADEVDLARQYVDHLLELIRERSRPMPGIPDVLVKLAHAGYRLALASSAEPEVIAANTGGLDIGHFFEAAISGTEVARGKPAPDVFLETVRRLRVAPGRCLVIEDSRNGLLAAKAAGMACAVVPCDSTRHQDFREADHRLDALPDLLALLPSGVGDTPARHRAWPRPAGPPRGTR